MFTPENPSFAIRDPSLERDVPPEAEVMRFPIWEPYDVFFRISGWFGPKKESTPTSLVPSTNTSAFQRVSAWVRGNFFIPDPRVFWVRPSVKFLADYIAANGISVIVTTAPPHSVHLIGLRLKKKFPHLRWLADFRDPWSEWGMWDSLGVSQPVRVIHKRMERNVLASADEIITITPFYARRFEKLANKPVKLLTNGFDEDDFRAIRYSRTEEFIIRHVGLVNEKCDPRPFMRALKATMATDSAFAEKVRLEFIGEVHPDFKAFVASDESLRGVTHFAGNIPHDDLILLYGSSSLLILILTGYRDAEGFLPGKLFEYMATGLPILGVGPVQGDAADVLRASGAGVMVDSENADGIQAALLQVFQQWSKNEKPAQGENRIGEFSRREITARLVHIL